MSDLEEIPIGEGRHIIIEPIRLGRDEMVLVLGYGEWDTAVVATGKTLPELLKEGLKTARLLEQALLSLLQETERVLKPSDKKKGEK